MSVGTYAVVSYLSGEVAQFVGDLRRRLNPRYADWRAHVSVLPPRLVANGLCTSDARLNYLREICEQVDPFEVVLDGVNTFWPVNGVVYLSIASGYDNLRDLHRLLNQDALSCQETYGYVPHVTIAQDLDEAATRQALSEVTKAWARFSQPVRFRVEQLILVEQTTPGKWTDLATLPLRTYSLSAS